MRTFWRLCAIVTLGGVGVGACLAALIPAAATLVAGNHYTGDVGKALKPLDERSVVYAGDGSVIGKLGRKDREPAKLGEVPPGLVDAVIATEDATFYTNPGVDLEAAARALFKNVGSGGILQGGSTITQQLIKNRIVGKKRDLARKIREAILALRINTNFSKNEILEQYLNTVYFGQGSYGVKAAAERMFIRPDPTTGFPVPKSLAQLDLADDALLAGLISNPEGNNPFANPQGALARRAFVLKRMLAQHYITKLEAGAALFAPLPTIKPVPELRPENYYVQQVQDEIINDTDNKFGLGRTESERRNKLLGGGLQIHTAFDATLQADAESAIRDTLPDDTNGATAALVAMDPANGHVLAVANGDRYDPGHQYNIATQGNKQQGSTYKVITLTAAMENGFSPNDTVDGTDGCEIPGYKYPPGGRNAEEGGGTMSLWNATSGSVNCAFLRLQQAVGTSKVADMAVKLGIRTRPDLVSSLTLGTVGSSPLEMATVYNTLAADGIRHDPVFVTRIDNSGGEVIFSERVGGERVVSEQTARTVTKLLEGVITGGTGTRAQLGRPAAGKTGTTDNKANAWFDGYVPQLTAVVWMGHLADQLPMGSVGGIGSVFGGTYPARIWAAFMKQALDGQPELGFSAPDESQWGSSRFITGKGRGSSGSSPADSSTTATTGPGAPPPTAGTTTTTAPATTSSSTATSSSTTSSTTP